MTGRRVVWPLALAVLAVLLLALLAWRWSAAEGGRLAAPTPAGGADETAASLPTFDADVAVAAGVAEALPEVAVDQNPTSAVPAPVAGATHGSLLVRVRWKADAAPAPGIGLRLLQWDRPSPSLHVVQGVTDERGEWLLRDVLPGEVTAYTDRAGNERADIVAGQLTEIEIGLKPGVWVRGTVVDAEKRLVPRAGIWLSDYGNGTFGRVAAQADDGGRFELRGVEPGHHIGAQAPGYTASAIQLVKPGKTEVELTLVLGPPGGTLRGHVRSHEGAALRDATILVGPERGWPVPDPTDQVNFRGPPPIWLTSDAEGAFATSDIPAGRVPIAVRADGWPSWGSAVDIAVGQTSEVEVELYPGGTVVGTVRDEAGQIVVGANIAYGHHSEMEWVSARSGADGRYELGSLRLGTLELHASVRGGGRDKTSLAVAAGADNEWNPILKVGLQVFGRVVDDTGAPAPGLFVDASNQGEWHGGNETDALGRFVISNCPEGAALTLIANDFTTDPPDLSLAVLTEVLPGPGEVLLTVPSSRDRSAHLVGRVEFTGGTPASDVQLHLTPEGVSIGEVLALDEQGSFRSEAKLAGRYRLQVGGDGLAEQSLEGLVLETGRTTDVGVIVVEQPGTVVLKPMTAAGFDPGPLRLWLWNKSLDLSLVAKRRPNGTYWARLQAGDYELRLSNAPGQPIASWSTTFTLAPGQALEHEVPVERGIACTVSIELGDGAPQASKLLARVIDPAGTMVLETTIRILESRARAMKTLLVKPGSYRFELRLDGDLALDEPMEVPDVGTEVLQFKWRVP